MGDQSLGDKHRILRRFRFHSIFAKTFSVQFILTLLVLILSYAFINHLYEQQYREQVFYAGFSKLSVASEELNQALDNITVQTQDLFRSSDCNRMLVNGDVSQNLLAVDTALRLSNLVQRDPYVKKAWLYLAQADTIIDSDKSITSRWKSSAATFFGAYALQSQKNQYLPLLLQIRGRLYLFDSFPEGKPLGVICILLNSEELYTYVKEDTAHPGKIYTYYYGNPIFSQLMNYPQDSDCQISSRQNLGNGKAICKIAGQNAGYFLTYESRITGLTYVLQADNEILHASWVDGLSFMIPFFAAVLFLLALASLYMVRFVYYPIQKVVLAMTENVNGENARCFSGDAPNELELIKSLHHESEQQRLTLSDMLSQVGNAVTKKLFFSILKQEESSSGKVLAILGQIHSPFPLEGTYQILLLNWFHNTGIVPTESEKELQKIRFMQISTSYWRSKGLLCALDETETREILILCFFPNCSVARINHWIQDYQEHIKAKAGERDTLLELGASRIYPNILDLRHALQDAESNLQQRLYYTKGQKPESEILALYRRQAEQVISSTIQKAEPDLNGLQMLIDDVRNAPEVAAQIYQMIMDLFREKLIYFNADAKADWIKQKNYLEEGPAYLERSDRHPQIVFEFCSEALKMISCMADKEQFRHLETARNYIESHYSDQDLSLYAVSRSCGISSSYLSKLFVNYQPPGFVDYLNQYRLEKAKALMVTTHYTIAEIGFKTGFCSPQNFTRVFKKYAGETPGQFRARHFKE